MSITHRLSIAALLFALMLALAGLSPSAHAQTLKVLYSFGGFNPLFPEGNLVRDAAGNLYGTTHMGGDFSGCEETGCGFVFKLDTTGKITVLHEFHNKMDGAYPSSLIGDAAGNIAGTSGAVFIVSAAGKFSSFNPFPTLSDGSNPSSLIRYQGTLYGTAGGGGDLNCNSSPYKDIGCGNVFMRDKNGNLTVLYNFAGPPDGNGPGGLIRDAAGNFYGMTTVGGDTTCPIQVFTFPGCGIAFKVDSTGHETVLHTFTGGADGAYPLLSDSGAAFVQDAAGNLYGTTWVGGDLTCGTSNYGCGVLFKLDTSGTETVLHTFTGQPDGASPNSGLFLDSKGNLYGTTYSGGQYNNGTIFKLDSKGNFTVLYSFGAAALDGENPSTGLISDPVGNLYGMTSSGGGAGNGTIFELTP
jgi:uncharacterized repeat protein (TIGR03803 family)